MRWNALTDVGKEELDTLVSNEVTEGPDLEYKQTLPGRSDEDRREFLADVAAMANGAGGTVVYGIVEKRDASGAKLGFPAEILGVDTPQLDADLLRLESMIRDGIAPRLHGVRVQRVDGYRLGSAVVVRIPRSWTGPHMVTFKNSSRFFVRAGAAKHQMDVHEIRAAFIDSERRFTRLAEFRTERVGRILAADTPVPVREGPLLALHVLPLMPDLAHRLQPDPARDHLLVSPPSRAGGTWSYRWNVDGFVAHDAGPQRGAHWYGQAFHGGAVEYVRTIYGTDNSLSGPSLEDQVIRIINNALETAGRARAIHPLFVGATLVGVSGLSLASNDRGHRGFEDDDALGLLRKAFDRDVVPLVEALVEDDRVPPAQLRTMLDSMWQAAGWPQSPNFDEAGDWTNRAR